MNSKQILNKELVFCHLKKAIWRLALEWGNKDLQAFNWL